MKQDEILEAGKEHELRTSQLRNFRVVLSKSMPTKRFNYLADKVLPGYIVRHRNAQNALAKAIEKKYKHPQ